MHLSLASGPTSGLPTPGSRDHSIEFFQRCWKRKMSIFLDDFQFFHARVAAQIETVHNLLYKDFRRGSVRCHADRGTSFEPLLADIVRVRDEMRIRSGTLSDLDKAI